MLAKRGARVLFGPTLRVFCATGDDALKAATLEVVSRPPDYLLASTGYGMRAWIEAAAGWGIRDDLIGSLRRARILNRGSKAASANAHLGLAEWWRAPGETLAEVVEEVLGEDLRGRRVVVQLHAGARPGACARLRDAGAEVVEIDAYRTSLPDDCGPARASIDAACAGGLAAVTFTAAPAVHNLFRLAEQAGTGPALRDAFAGSVVAACVGPVCAEGAREEGIAAPVVPERARLVPMIHALTDHLAGRRTSGPRG